MLMDTPSDCFKLHTFVAGSVAEFAVDSSRSRKPCSGLTSRSEHASLFRAGGMAIFVFSLWEVERMLEVRMIRGLASEMEDPVGPRT